MLLSGGSALDAVEAAVRVLEDNPRFNAGTGSALARDGRVEMDALIQDGRQLASGSVTGVDAVAHPISLARAVMERSPHAFLTGAAAAALAAATGMPLVDNASLVTAARREQLANERAAAARGESGGCDPWAAVALPEDALAPTAAAVDAGVDAGDHDTVGAVALDAHGNVACATSTGGITGKWPGRVGDCPLVGAGGVADNDVGAVSTTGTGEYILRWGLARGVCESRARQALGGGGDSAAEAVRDALTRMKRRMDNDPGEGVIFVTADGDCGCGHSTPRMSWAAAAAAHDGSGAVEACGVTAGEAPDANGVFAARPL